MLTDDVRGWQTKPPSSPAPNTTMSHVNELFAHINNMTEDLHGQVNQLFQFVLGHSPITNLERGEKVASSPVGMVDIMHERIRHHAEKVNEIKTSIEAINSKLMY